MSAISLPHLRKRFLIILSIGIVVSAVSIGFIVARADIREANPETAESAIPDPTPDPNLAPHTLVGSYYTLDENIDAKLLLNNKGATQLEVQPTLYSADGQELVLPAVYVDAQSFRFINLQDWAAVGGHSFRSGNIKLFHLGKDLVLGAQIYLTHEGKSLTFEEKLVEVGKFNSTRQEAVWSMPSNNAEVRVVLTNTTANALDVTGTIAKKPHNVSDPRTITIPPHSTRAFDLRDEFPGSNSYLNSDVVAMSLEHCGANEALLSRLLVYEQNKGFSNTVQFSNPAGGKSNSYEGVGFQIEDIGNQKMYSVIVARNVGTESTTVTANVPYTRSNGTRSNIALPQLNLSPGEMRAFNTKKIMERADDENIKVASLEISYTSAPGSVIVGTHSQSNSRDHVFRVPMWDPLGQKSPTGGYPWRIEGNSITETYIKNISDLEEDYIMTIFWADGMYVVPRGSVRPHETLRIDVKQLRDEQIPDIWGTKIPLTASSGQISWSLRRKDSLPIDDQWANLALMGRTEQVDLTSKIVNSYACQNWCDHTAVPDSGYILPEVSSLEVGASVSFTAYENIVDTYGGNQGGREASGEVTWSTTNSSAIQVNQTNGYAVAIASGESAIAAHWDGQTHWSLGGCYARPGFAGDYLSPECQAVPASKAKNPSPEDDGGGTCGPCGHGTTPLTDSTLISVTLPPLPTISDIVLVEKNGLKTVNVSISGATEQTNTTFRLRRTSGSGDATFEDDTIEKSYTGNLLSTELKIKGVSESSAANNYVMEAVVNQTVHQQSAKTFTVAVITSLIFERINTTGTPPAIDVPFDDNPGVDGIHIAGEGQRIYPDKNTNSDTTDRATIRVKATVAPANVSGLNVHYASFDVDDPSATGSPIDTTNSDGVDNNGHVSNSKSGIFSPATGVSCTNASVGTSPLHISKITCPVTGTTTSTHFQVTMQPGDNFAVAASLVNEYRDEFRVNTSAGANLINTATQTLPISGEANPNNIQGIRTQMLTVWRRLHIEVDSMGNVSGNSVSGTFGSSQTIASGGNTTVNVSSQLEANRFENGRLVVTSISPQRSFDVVDETPTVTANTTSSVTITNAGVALNLTAQDTFVLYDDDDMNDDGVLDGDQGDGVALPDTSLLTDNSSNPANNLLAAAYIVPRYDLANPNTSVSFVANIESSRPALDAILSNGTGRFDNFATEASTDFWTIYLLGAYQLGEQSDGDPRTVQGGDLIATYAAANVFNTSAVPRVTDGYGSVLLMEMGRPNEYPSDYATRPVSRAHTVPHEVGHLFGCIHGEGGIMEVTQTRTVGTFSESSRSFLRMAIHP